MAAKILLALTAQVLLIQVAVCNSIAMQSVGPYSNAWNNNVVNTDVDVNNYAINGLGYGATQFPASFGSSIFNNDLVLNNVGSGYNGIGSVGLNNVASGYNSIGLGNFGIGSVGLNNVASGFNSIEYGNLGNFGLGSYGGVSSVAAPVGISSATLAGVGGYNIVPGSPLAVTNASPFGPSGLAVASENTLEGILTISGQLPFLSAVTFEGALPTAGSGVATCGCGNGQVGIIGEGVAPVLPFGPGIYY